MEKYSKTFNSKWQNQYSEEFKRSVCKEYLQGSIGIRSTEQKYKLGNSRLTAWLKEYGYEVKRTNFVALPHLLNTSKSNNQETESSKQLKQQLEDAQLLAEAYRKMIELAERDFKINIRKKSNTK